MHARLCCSAWLLVVLGSLRLLRKPVVVACCPRCVWLKILMLEGWWLIPSWGWRDLNGGRMGGAGVHVPAVTTGFVLEGIPACCQ